MKKFLIAVFSIMIAVAVIIVGINFFVVLSGGRYLLDSDEAQDASADCIMVLGCSVNSDGTPSELLKDRLDKAIDLYWDGAADKLLLTGDNGTEEYDEVKAMKNYALSEGVPAEDIFLDHAGFSTYESMYRAKAVFGVESAIVVTQEYHEYRALYTGHALGIEVLGVAADDHDYGKETSQQIREFLAREKAFIDCITKPEPTYLGNPIDMSGSGTVSW